MKWLLTVLGGLSALFKLLAGWMEKKQKEQKKDEDNYKKLEDAVNSDADVSDVQRAADDYTNRL